MQVLTLLDALEMPQYKAAFKREKIDGELLVECDELILENELSVSVTLHRIRLMKIIAGEISAQEILNKSHYIYLPKSKPM